MMKGTTLIIWIVLLLVIVQSLLYFYSSSFSVHILVAESSNNSVKAIPLPSVSTSAPIGIADYGISPSSAYIRETTQWL